MKPLNRWYSLLLISSLGLFLELAVIRWIAGEVRLFSYFKNLPLLAAFLGLAIGFGLVRKNEDYQSTFAPLFGLFVVLVILVGRVLSPRALAYPSRGDEYLWFTGDFSYWLALFLFLSVVAVFFLLIMMFFIPIGQATGREMDKHKPIPAYVANLIGSLIGIWIFAVLSYFQTPPAVWFGLALLGLSVFWFKNNNISRRDILIFVVSLIGLIYISWGITWSPYHRLEIIENTVAENSEGQTEYWYMLNVQQVFYQSAMNLSTEFVSQFETSNPELESATFTYNLPYRLHPAGDQVLIVGAGMGNDAAAALRNGAAHVDAVEIDPAILDFGREFHPEDPYTDSRVSLIVDDARSFFEKSTKQYDLISFGLLDSQTLLSGLSNVRLDSFVYTLESLEQAKSHLSENGIVALTFGAKTNWIDERLGHLLTEVFGTGQVYVYHGDIGTTFVASNTNIDTSNTNLVPWQSDPEITNLPLTTDDWPYLYLRARSIPDAYWQAILLIVVLSMVMISRSFPQALKPEWDFLLLGAAFLLIEFKSITELALLFGTTWIVNALAISGVLLMALAANIIVLWRSKINLNLSYVFLFSSLALSYFFPLDILIGTNAIVRVLASTLLLSLPIFFAGLIFSESLRQAGETGKPLASNLSGSVAGGVLEYGSILWGIKSLYIIAAIVYLGAWITSRKKK
ncbi:MAG: hypothetical protein ISR58_01765 [Anaerolineales bacterium]|nr:hypothetical protein [Chloroflexota bacterium]MBL6979893.1 hypothetical protein [Anaerolineales bacterium]